MVRDRQQGHGTNGSVADGWRGDAADESGGTDWEGEAAFLHARFSALQLAEVLMAMDRGRRTEQRREKRAER